MIALDAGFIAAALAVGVAIGGHCAAFSSREQRREDHAERDRADRAEAQAAAWELRAQHLATALERFVPREVDATGNVVRFPDRAAG